MWKHKESKWLVRGGRKVRCYLCGKKILAKGDLFLFHQDTGYYSHQSCMIESTAISGNERRRAVKKIAVGAAVVGAIAAGAGKLIDISSQSEGSNSPDTQTILTSQGLILPALTSDPANPVPGQMWYRSDAGVMAHFDAIENRVIYSNRIVNGSAVVASKGIVNGLSVLPNDGQDWGPDTTLGATAPGQYGAPYTTTSGRQEANNFCHNSTSTKIMFLQNGTMEGTPTYSSDVTVLQGDDAGGVTIATGMLTAQSAMTNPPEFGLPEFVEPESGLTIAEGSIRLPNLGMVRIWQTATGSRSIIEMDNGNVANFTDFASGDLQARYGSAFSWLGYVFDPNATQTYRFYKRVNGTDTELFTLGLDGQVLIFNSIPTVGLGLPPIYGLDNRTGLTAADTSPITLYTVPASGQVFRLTGRIYATSGTSASYVLKWTEGGVVVTKTLTVTAVDSDVDQPSILIQPDSGTNITSQLTSVTSSTVNVAASVERIA